MYLLRPTQLFANPPLCTLHELRTVYTIDDLANFHEILNLRNATIARATRDQERDRQNRPGKRR